jgi:membrane-bound inhibitor of C-type lysozyme
MEDSVPMKTLFTLVASTYFAVACTPHPVTSVPPSIFSEIAYSCTNGQSLSVRFFPQQGVAVLVRNGETMELDQQPSGSGFIYRNGPNTVRGKGDDLTVEIGRMVPLQCSAS